MKIQRIVLALMCVAGCAQAQKITKSSDDPLERDWTIEKDILVNHLDPRRNHFLSLQVYARHPRSSSRMISFGSFPKASMRMQVWQISNQKLQKILDRPSASFESLLKNPDLIKKMEAEISSAGQLIGDASNTKKFEQGEFYGDRSAFFYGLGTVPKVTQIPGPINKDTRIVVFLESQPRSQKIDAKEDIASGRSYFFNTEDAIQIVTIPSRWVKGRKAFFEKRDRNQISKPPKKQKPQNINRAGESALGVQETSLPYDHHIAIGWAK